MKLKVFSALALAVLMLSVMVQNSHAVTYYYAGVRVVNKDANSSITGGYAKITNWFFGVTRNFISYRVLIGEANNEWVGGGVHHYYKGDSPRIYIEWKIGNEYGKADGAVVGVATVEVSISKVDANQWLVKILVDGAYGMQRQITALDFEPNLMEVAGESTYYGNVMRVTFSDIKTLTDNGFFTCEELPEGYSWEKRQDLDYYIKVLVPEYYSFKIETAGRGGEWEGIIMPYSDSWFSSQQ